MGNLLQLSLIVMILHVMFGWYCSAANHYDTLLSNAKTFAHARNFSSADSVLDVLLERNSDDYDALVLKAYVLSWQKKYTDAGSLFSRVIAMVPGYADAWYGMIECLRAGNEAEKACSLISEAYAFHPEDSVILKKKAEMCSGNSVQRVSEENNNNDDGNRFWGSLRVTGFEASFQRSLWQEAVIGYGKEFGRWRCDAEVRGQRRVYDQEVVTAAELEFSSQVSIIPSYNLILRSSLSPYMFVDTLYPYFSLAGEMVAGLPWNLETDATFRLRAYEDLFTYQYSAGVGVYIGSFLIYPHGHCAFVDSRMFFSGSGEIRKYSLKSDRDYIAGFASAGRTPYDGGSVAVNGYFNVSEFGVKIRRGFGGSFSALSGVAFATEQVVKYLVDNVSSTEYKDVGAVRMKVSWFIRLEA